MTAVKYTRNKKEVIAHAKKNVSYIKRNLEAILNDLTSEKTTDDSLITGNLLIGITYETLGCMIDNVLEVALGRVSPQEIAHAISENIKEHLNFIYQQAVVVH